jgi:hypothetical protein
MRPLPSTVSIVAIDPIAAEPADDGEFTITLSQASATDTVVLFTVAGTATAGADYFPIGFGVIIPAGATSASVPVDVIDDLNIEGTETVVVELTGTSDPNILITAANRATVLIFDNDFRPPPTITSFTSNSDDCGMIAEGQSVIINGDFRNPDVSDIHAATINWGDGTTTAAMISESSGSGSFQASHVYANGGIYTVTVTLTDDDTGTATATTETVIVGTGVVNGVLYVIGTANADHVTINRVVPDTIRVHADFLPSGNYKDIAAVGVNYLMAILCEGDDHVSVTGDMNLPALIHGGGGADHFNGDGSRNVLIGGRGTDRLVGGNNEDALIGSSTDIDHHWPTLQAALVAWAGGDSYADRIAAIEALFNALDDGDVDTLTGSSGRDLFFNGLGDHLTDVVTGGPNSDTVIGLG